MEKLPFNLLIADDDEINRLISNKILEGYFNLIDFAANGVEALDKIYTKAYDVILMDINMPLKDGFEVVSELRDSDDLYFKTLPVIAYTASIMFDEAENILESGFTSYLSKPVNVNILINEIKKHSLVSVK